MRGLHRNQSRLFLPSARMLHLCSRRFVSRIAIGACAPRSERWTAARVRKRDRSSTVPRGTAPPLLLREIGQGFKSTLAPSAKTRGARPCCAAKSHVVYEEASGF